MILVDSSVWIDIFRGRKTQASRFLKNIQETNISEICISSIIYFEVLRGIRSDLDRKKIQRDFDHFIRKDYINTGFDKLTSHYQIALRKKLPTSKLGDWLILKTVLDHNLTLLTSDKDFYRIQEIIPFSLIKFV